MAETSNEPRSIGERIFEFLLPFESGLADSDLSLDRPGGDHQPRNIGIVQQVANNVPNVVIDPVGRDQPDLTGDWLIGVFEELPILTFDQGPVLVMDEVEQVC